MWSVHLRKKYLKNHSTFCIFPGFCLLNDNILVRTAGKMAKLFTECHKLMQADLQNYITEISIQGWLKGCFHRLQRVVLTFSSALQQNILHLWVLMLRERMCLDFKSVLLQPNGPEKNCRSSHFFPGMNTPTAIGNGSFGGESLSSTARSLFHFIRTEGRFQKSRNHERLK